MELGGTSVVELDTLDFREWLSGNGANRNRSTDRTSSNRSTTPPFSIAARQEASELRRWLRGASVVAALGGYKDAFAYESRAGLGEIVVAPIYRVLRARGVRFEFFYKLTDWSLTRTWTASHRSISTGRSISATQPTSLRSAPRSEFGYLECWPYPLVDRNSGWRYTGGARLDLGVSFWCNQKTGKATCAGGRELDERCRYVGAFKPDLDVAALVPSSWTPAAGSASG